MSFVQSLCSFGLNPFGLERNVDWRRLVLRNIESITGPPHHCARL